MATLLRSEAVARRQILQVRSMQVQLDLTGADGFTSRAVIDFDATPGVDTFIEFAGEDLLSVGLNGQPLPPDVWDGARIKLTELSESNQLIVTGRMAYSSDGEGLHRSVDPADGRPYLYAMSFLDAAPRWFACFDQPDLKAPYVIDVVTPEDWIVRGIGPATALGQGRWRIEQPRPLPTYLVAIVAGPWVSITDTWRDVPLSVLARASMADQLASQASDIFEVTKACFAAYHDMFGLPYPFGEYHQVFAPDFNAGAMENPGCVVFRDQLLFRGSATQIDRAGRAGVIAHEMAHQWFGDLVTMRWWDDLWLNESFAEYMGHRVCSEATEYELWTEFGVVRKNWGAIADQSPATHPVAFNGAENAAAALANFDGISYAKGASLLRQLAVTLGDDIFLGGLNAHFEAHQFGNAELADLLAAWTSAGAEGLDEWSTEWLAKPDMDVLTPVRGESGWVVERQAPAAHPADRTHAIRCVELGLGGEVLGADDLLITSERTPLTLAGHGVIVPDALDMTWARVRPSTWELPTGIEDEATRVVLLNAIRDAVRNGDLGSSRAFDLVLTGAAQESSVMILRGALEAGRGLCGAWCPPALRADRRARLATLTRRLLTSAEPGSDAELISLKTFIDTSSDAELLGSWLSAGHADGRHLTADVRWQLVTRLMVLGADPALIDVELGQDPSTAGHDAAAGARAAIGAKETKEAALELVLGRNDRRAYELYAIGAQLFLPEQYELMRPYVARYFERLLEVAEFRQGWALKLLVARSFPAAMVDAETLHLAEQLLETEGLNEPLRRALLEPVHQLEQAVRASALTSG